MRPNATVELIGRPLVQFALVALVAVLLGEGELGWAWGVGYVPAAAVAWWWWRGLSACATPLPPEPALSREFWRFTIPRALTGVVQAASQRLDIVLVAALAGPAAAAVYAAASRFIVVGQMGNNAISLAAQPPLSLALARGDRPEVNHIYQLSTAWLMIITWPLYLMLTVFGGLLLNVFGSGYGSGGAVLLVLSGAMSVWARVSAWWTWCSPWRDTQHGTSPMRHWPLLSSSVSISGSYPTTASLERRWAGLRLSSPATLRRCSRSPGLCGFIRSGVQPPRRLQWPCSPSSYFR